MRLLLLLSALFAALSGATGTRAQAQPVQASAVVPAAAATVAATSVATTRFVGAAFGRVPPQPPLPRLIGAVSAPPLYAERRRE